MRRAEVSFAEYLSFTEDETIKTLLQMKTTYASHTNVDIPIDELLLVNRNKEITHQFNIFPL